VSSVSTSQQQLILDLLLGKLGEQEFYDRYPTSAAEVTEVGLHMLERGLQERDPVAVEFGLYITHRFGVTPQHLGVLNALAPAPWHERHEDAVSALAQLRDPSSVVPLYEAARLRLAYLEYDESFALARKAIRALQGIQTVEAVDRLGLLAKDAESPVSDYAQSALRKLASDGEADEVRQRAQQLSGRPG
jgi:hypothetical protein